MSLTRPTNMRILERVNINVYLPDSFRERLAAVKGQINVSAVVRAALNREIQRMTTNTSRHVITDANGIKRTFTGIYVGDGHEQANVYATHDGRVIVHADDLHVVDGAEQIDEYVTSLVAAGHGDTASGLIEALGLDIEVPL